MKGLLIQEFKTLFKSPAAISILIIPIVLMVGLGYLLPSGWIVPSAITIGIVGSVLLYFGGSLEEIKRTSFMKSISLTKLNKFTFLATKILFSVFISLFSVLWVLFFAWIFTDQVDFLANDFSHLIPPTAGIENIGQAISGLGPNGNAEIIDVIVYVPFHINWDKIDWVAMLYAGIITIIVSISLSFVFVSFSKSSLSFYLMSFGYLLSMILFGGVVMPSFLIDKDTNGWFTYLYYLIPNYYTNNVMATSFNNGIGDAVNRISDSADGIMLILGKLNIQGTPTDADIASLRDLFFTHEFGKGTFFNPYYYGWSGTVDDLNTWWNAIVGTDAQTEFLTSVHDALLNPLVNGGYDGWKDLIRDEFTTPILIPLINEILDSQYGQPLLDYINGQAGLSLTIKQIEGILNLPGASGLLTGVLFDGSLPKIVGEDIVNKLPLIVQEGLINHLFLILFQNHEKIDGISNTVLGLTGTLRGMFNTAHWWDYVVPWGETAIFLLISTKFFKWS